MFGDEEIAEEIHVHHEAPLLGGERVHGFGNEHARVRDDDIELAECLDRAIHQSGDLLFICHVYFDGECALPGRLGDAGGGRFRAFAIHALCP